MKKVLTPHWITKNMAKQAMNFGVHHRGGCLPWHQNLLVLGLELFCKRERSLFTFQNLIKKIYQTIHPLIHTYPHNNYFIIGSNHVLWYTYSRIEMSNLY